MPRTEPAHDNTALNIKHADFVRQIEIKELAHSDKDVSDLSTVADKLDAIFGDDKKDYPHVQK